ncbi:hypothetical protein ACFL6M_02945 [Candidatus Eisenbacteria bacterium]|uniref:Response regulatory domain-containing protein n=1 Tax=Eiseniibacteriota bacterium TaxID=2212470 RepID=A0ABV6YJQ5_UNCEI
MSKSKRNVVLIHWNEAEAATRLERLKRAGYEAVCLSDQDSATFRKTRSNPPDIYVIDLTRAPSAGRSVAVWLRQQKATRGIPIVFITGDSEKTEGVRKLLPDAIYTDWPRIRSALGTAMRGSPKSPVVPGTMQGYSGTPLVKKLGIREGTTLALLGAPSSFERLLKGLPGDVTIRKQARGNAAVIILFVNSRAVLERRFPTAAKMLAPGGKFWIAWPKKASGVCSDLTQATVRAFGLSSGFVDYKISAVDETWSALCFARRGSRTKKANR